jgi:hypothetical protein
MKGRTSTSTFFLPNLIAFLLFVAAIGFSGCSAHSLSGPELDSPTEEVQAREEGAPNLHDPIHNEDPGRVPTGGNGGSIDYMAEHNETNE